MAKQKMKWIPTEKQMPENYQSQILVAWRSRLNSDLLIIGTTMFDPKESINPADGKWHMIGTYDETTKKFVTPYDGEIVEYWSPIDDLPRTAGTQRIVNDIPAITCIPEQRFEKTGKPEN